VGAFACGTLRLACRLCADGQHSAQVSATAVADDYILSASWDGGLCVLVSNNLDDQFQAAAFVRHAQRPEQEHPRLPQAAQEERMRQQQGDPALGRRQQRVSVAIIRSVAYNVLEYRLCARTRGSATATSGSGTTGSGTSSS